MKPTEGHLLSNYTAHCGMFRGVSVLFVYAVAV